MSSAAAYNAIHDLLAVAWTATPIVFENEAHPLPGSPEHWVLVEIFGDTFDQMSIGAGTRDGNLWRETGVAYLNVMTTRDIGSQQARIYAGQLVDLMRGLDVGAVRCLDASIGAGAPGEGDGNYWRMTATVTWERDQ